jgi:hypothetical protein
VPFVGLLQINNSRMCLPLLLKIPPIAIIRTNDPGWVVRIDILEFVIEASSHSHCWADRARHRLTEPPNEDWDFQIKVQSCCCGPHMYHCSGLFHYDEVYHWANLLGTLPVRSSCPSTTTARFLDCLRFLTQIDLALLGSWMRSSVTSPFLVMSVYNVFPLRDRYIGGVILLGFDVERRTWWL